MPYNYRITNNNFLEQKKMTFVIFYTYLINNIAHN